MEEELAADIETVVDDRAILEPSIKEARQAKIQGEVAQPDVMELLDNHDPLFRLCKYEYRQRNSEEPAPLQPVSEHLASDGYLEDSTQEAFVEFWDDIEWIVPSVSVPSKNLGGLEEHWSDIVLRPLGDQPEMMEYTMRWGVDERLEAKIPGQRILARAVSELDFVAGYFQYWQETDEIDDELVAYLAQEYDLAWTTDMLRDVLSKLESIDHDGTDVSGPAEDPDLEVTWNDTASGDDVVGKIRVTPPGKVMKRDEESDDGDTPPRGFQ